MATQQIWQSEWLLLVYFFYLFFRSRPGARTRAVLKPPRLCLLRKYADQQPLSKKKSRRISPTVASTNCVASAGRIIHILACSALKQPLYCNWGSPGSDLDVKHSRLTYWPRSSCLREKRKKTAAVLPNRLSKLNQSIASVAGRNPTADNSGG